MPDLDFVTMDVFTDRPFGGNPLAIVPRAEGLDDRTMQSIAREFNLSETVFFLPGSDGADADIRIFTPFVELPFAGHPTVGAAAYLAGERGGRASRMTLRTRLGLVEAEASRLGDRLLESLISAPRLPARASAPDRETAAALLGLAPDEVVRDPAGWHTGQPFTFVPLKSRDALARSALDAVRWNKVRAEPWAGCLYPFSMADWQSGDIIHARMFGPGVGIAEDPATGGAATALAGLLCDWQDKADGAWTWTIHQGEEMGRPSRIGLEVDVRDGKPASVRLRGTVVPMTTGVLSL